MVSSECEMKRLLLHKFHKAHGFLQEFSGFEMPFWYKGVISEHMAVRENVGIFDVSHMGRAIITGKNANEFLNYVTSSDISKLHPFQGQYSTMCNVNGGIVDDLTVYKIKDYYLIVYNSMNIRKDYQWLIAHAKAFDVKISNIADETVMFALQGPKASFTLQKLVKNDLAEIKDFHVKWMKVFGEKVLIMKGGYTGEKGFELILFKRNDSNSDNILKVWNNLLENGKESKIEPCGLGARDSLRLEAGFCLYGNDITEEITPYEAKLDFAVNINKGDFIGKKALVTQKKVGVSKIRTGFKMVNRGIPRYGFKIFGNRKEVGYVTSGGFSSLLKSGIGMGYVPPDLDVEGTTLHIEVRGRLLESKVVKMPFYDVNRYGRKRKVS